MCVYIYIYFSMILLKEQQFARSFTLIVVVVVATDSAAVVTVNNTPFCVLLPISKVVLPLSFFSINVINLG